jgi:hypothetical protein
VDVSSLPPYAIVVAAPVLWLALCQLLGLVSGWRRLAELYPHSGVVPDGVVRFRSGRMGWIDYGNCLVVGAAEAGLYLAVLLPFRPGHPSLFVPWHDVHAEPAGGWRKHVGLRFARAPSVAFRLAGEHPEIVRRAAGRPGA